MALGTFSGMERFFLALIVSGLLLAVAAASLFVATGADDHAASLMNVSPVPGTLIHRPKPRQAEPANDRR